MKTAKKVLSVVLAIAMALSCFAVAASAYGPDNATYKATWWLTASTGSYSWSGTGTKAKAVAADNEECEHGEIIADPGETIWIRLYITNNYYPEAFAAPIFYSKDLINAYNVYYNQYGKAPGSTVKKYYFTYVNEDGNDYIASSGGSDSIIDPTFFETNVKVDDKSFYPTEDNSDVKLLTTDEYHFDAYYWLHDAGNSEENYILEDYGEDNDEYAWLFKVPFQIPSTAAKGTKYTVLIPELTMKREGKKDGITQFAISSKQDGTVPLDPPIIYSADQNFDFSDAKIDIYVTEKPGDTPTLDYARINAAIASFEALTETDWTADSWADALAAYEEATDAKTSATAQTALDNAAIALEDAIIALEEAGPDLDFTELEAAIGKTPDDLSAYTTSTASAVDTAYDNAVAARSADNQDDIDAATIALNEAIDALKLKVDTTELAAALAAAAAVEDKADWYELDADDLDDAVAEGMALMANADDTSVDAQDTFDDAADAINYILEHHMYSVADYSRIVELQDQVAALNEADYTAASWEVLEAALDAVVPGLLRSKQGQVDEMAENIELAIDGLKELAYTGSLELYVAQANAAEEADYAADVWAAIQDKVATANTYIGAGLARDDVQADIDALAMELVNLLNTKLADADYTAVYAALEKVPADIESGLYTEESKAILDAACEAVDFSLKADKQDEVDAMAQAIEDALTGLSYKAANLGALATALAKAQDVDPELVSEDSYLALDLAMAAAGTLMGSEIDIRDQADVDAAVAALNDAYDALVWLGADYTALDAAIAKYDDLDEDLYTAASLLAAKTAYDAAKAVARDLGKADQDTINTAANALDAAIEGLEYLPGDYSRIDALQATVDAIGTANEWRYDESLTELKAILADLDKNLTKKDQATIDAAADAGEAIELKYSAYDYTDYNTAINEFRALNPDDYTTESYQAALAAINGINWNLTNSVDDYKAGGKYLATLKKALKVGTGGLVEVGPADYTAVDAAIAVANGKNEDDYTPESWAALDAAIKAVVRGVNANYQDEVDKMAADINAAIAALVEKAAPVNYDLLAAKYDAVKDTELENAVVGKDAFENALAAAKDILDNRTADQATVDAALETLTEAYEALKFGADYSALIVAVAAAEAKNEADWTAESWAALESALRAADEVPGGLTTENQKRIDDATAAILTAIENLVPYVAPVVPADYDALNATIGEADVKDESLYTEASWAAFAAALAQAKAVEKNLTADDQAIIDNLNTALANAMAALEVKPAVVGGSITNVTWIPTKENRTTFEVTVQGRASFVQFVEFDHNSGTRSKSRYSDGVTIVSYDKDGNEVDSRSIDLAYEVWTITDQYLAGPSMGARAKFGTKWEAMDDCYTFTYAPVESDIAIRKAELSSTSGEMGKVPCVVVVGPDVEYVQYKNDNGTTSTKAASKATVLEDGSLQFTFNCYATHEGECVFTIRALCNDKWTDLGTMTYTVGSAEERLPK